MLLRTCGPDIHTSPIQEGFPRQSTDFSLARDSSRPMPALVERRKANPQKTVVNLEKGEQIRIWRGVFRKPLCNCNQIKSSQLEQGELKGSQKDLKRILKVNNKFLDM